MGKTLIILGTLLVVILLVLSACAPTPAPTPAPAPAPRPTPPPTIPEQRIDTIYTAGSRVDAHLYNLTRTPEAKMLLAEYVDNRWNRYECISVFGYSPGNDNLSIKYVVFTEQDYDGWDVKEYIIQHIFDSEFEPGTKMLQQILNSDTCFYGCGPTDETTYPVTWAVDRQTGSVTPYDGNALRVEAELIK